MSYIDKCFGMGLENNLKGKSGIEKLIKPTYMNDNKELNDNLQRLFSTIKDAYGIASMIKDIKEKGVIGKAPDYEILSFKAIGCDHIYDAVDLEFVLHSYPIYSARRKSDLEVFTQKDLTDEGVIKEFYISENKLWVRTEEKGGVVSINDIQKVKEPTKLNYEILDYEVNHWAGKYDNRYTIKSVRRLSDNEVFSIGDILHDGCIETTITSISGGNYPILKGDKGSIGLDVARKKRVPLFTTEDGKEIFEGDEYWYVYEDFRIKHIDKADNSVKGSTLKRFLSTEDKAKTFIYENKPILSYNDAVHWLASDGSGYGLYEIVKEKIDKKGE